jgi:transposase
MRTRYNREFKIQAVEMIMDQKKPVTQTARELGISSKTLHNWLRQYRKDQEQAFPGKGNLKQEDQKKSALEKENRELREELAIIKKALRIFAKDPS